MASAVGIEGALLCVGVGVVQVGPQRPQPAGGGTRLRLEHTGFAAGGPPAAGVRDLLDSGWGANLLRGTLPALLDRWAAGQPPPLAQPTTQEDPS